MRSDSDAMTAAVGVGDAAALAGGEAAPPSARCPRHPRETLQLFCETCDALTCRDCQLSDCHRDHRYQFVTAAAAAHRVLLVSLVAKLDEKRAYVESAKTLVASRRADIDRKEAAVAHDVKEFALRIITALNQRGKELLAQVSGDTWMAEITADNGHSESVWLKSTFIDNNSIFVK